MQLNKTKAGSGACLQWVKTSPPGSDYQKNLGYLWKHVIPLFLLVICLSASTAQVMAGAPNPKITLTKKNSTLQEIFKEIQKQTRYAFVYNNEMMRETKRINIDVRDASIEQVLSIVFKDQPVTYSLVDKIVVIKKRKNEPLAGADTTRISGPEEIIDISGKILDELSNPIPRASITIKNKSKATSTDNNGQFILRNVPVNATILITCIGYEPKILIASSHSINANLKVAINNMDETVVVAYRTTTQKANTGAISVVKGDQIKTLPNRSFDKSLQGLVPGLAVTGGSGQPGSAPANFVLRGIATGGNPYYGESFRNPLIVIDGVPVTQDPATSPIITVAATPSNSNPMAQINPSDIESITILKDAAAASLYGSKASNGVILVTTKRGKSGKTNFNFRHQTDLASRLEGKVKKLNQQQYVELLKEGYKNSTPGISDAEIMTDLYNKFPVLVKSPGDTSFYPQDDWINALYNKHALTTSNEINISGGSAKSTYYLNLEYTKQNGVIKHTDYDRKSLRLNVDNKLTPWLKLAMNTGFSYNLQNYNERNGLEEYISPLLPIKNSQNNYIYNYSTGLGSNAYDYVANPVAAGEMNINRFTTYRGISSMNIAVTPTPWLTMSSTLGFDFMLTESKQKNHPEFILNGEYFPGTGRVMEENFRNANLIATNTAQFDKTFVGKHNFHLLIGQEAQIRSTKFQYSSVLGIGDNPSTEELAGGKFFTTNGRKYKQTLASYFSQLNYSWNDKYFLSGSVRRDGSSQFGNNVRFGTFWSAGAGWVITEEDFMKNNLPWINFLKIRGSIGSSGNSSAIPSSLKYDLMSIFPFLGNTAVVPMTGVPPGNESIQWESTVTRNLGIELRLFKDRISLDADIYTRKTRNIIADNIKLPSATGYDYFTDNIGDLKNKGIELSLAIQAIRTKTFAWTINAKWSKNSNRLVKAYYPSLTVYGTGTLVNEVGKEYNSFYLPVWAGVNPDNGRPTWEDSTTGKPTENYYAAKKEIVGKAQPDGFGSVMNLFRYQNFELSVMIYYQYGSKIYFNAGSLLSNDGYFPYLNQITGSLDRWQKPGDHATNPRRLLNGSTNTPTGVEYDLGWLGSTRFLYNGDFVRLSNINIAFNFPQQLISPLKMSSLKIYIQGNNLATWTKYSGRDPENINAFGTGDLLYPVAKTFTVGAQIGF